MIKTLAVASVMLAGCTKPVNAPQEQGAETTKTNTPAQVQTASKVSFLCIGMEYSKRFGECPGCELDSKRLTTLLGSKYGYKGETLVSASATKSAVVERLKKGIEQTPEDGMFMFLYSGHGGQESLGGKEPDGADRKDEYLCLYDTYMLDDEIWEIVSKCKGRVFLYFDACHSATMYRSVASDLNVAGSGGKPAAKALGGDLVRSSGFTFHPERFVGAQAMWSDGKPLFRMLCWSGCKESQYSYGGGAGGVMTSALVRNWEKGMSYSLLWGRTRRDVIAEQPTQIPIQTLVGDWPTLSEAFR